jgi:hypothetical protein
MAMWKQAKGIYSISMPHPWDDTEEKNRPPSDDFIREILLNRPIGKDGKRRF